MGYAGMEGLKKLAAADYQMVESAHLDARVLAATSLLSLLVSLLAGIFPAIEAGAVDIRNALSEAGGRGVSGRRKRWSRRLLVSGEVALAVMLLIGAGLLVRTVTHLYQLRPGFEPAHLITASFSLQDARYSDGAHVTQLYDSGLERIRALPGVESAGAALTLPYQRGLNTGVKRVDGPQADTDWRDHELDYVTPGFSGDTQGPAAAWTPDSRERRPESRPDCAGHRGFRQTISFAAGPRWQPSGFREQRNPRSGGRCGRRAAKLRFWRLWTAGARSQRLCSRRAGGRRSF